jgi:hypothetical protein
MPISSNTSSSAFTPTEVLYDPTNKLRVASPQALIDTDFEYSTQPSKWESQSLINNRPFSFQSATPLAGITGITQNLNSRTATVSISTVAASATSIAFSSPLAGYATVTTGFAHNFTTGMFVTLSGSSGVAGLNSTFLITNSTSGSTTFVIQTSLTGSAAWSSGLATANVAPPNGTPITVQDTLLNIANGNYLVDSGGGTGTFTYVTKATNTTGVTQIFDGNKTVIYAGTLFTGSSIGGVGTATFTLSTNKVTVTTAVPHGLSLGNEVAITGTTTSAGTVNGSYSVQQITSDSAFSYYTPGTAPTSLVFANANVYVRPQGQVLHRPFDGGVIFSTNAYSNVEQTIRQTRRYFRYQSGKGMQMSSGTILKPNLQLDSLTASGTTVTVQTKEKHNITPGTVVTISGANESGYNGTFTITDITGFNRFRYTVASSLSGTPTASGNYSVSVVTWYGAQNRLGMFDSQNGVFWEYNGSTLYVVRRSSTYQISGKVNITNGSNTIAQTDSTFPTSFNKQLVPGDWVVIRGQSYRVTSIASDTNMTVSPAYRGATSTYAIISKVVETRIPQSSFNLDKVDGTGPSGYNIDLSKMQMFYIDYTWYGAGFIRWGLRGPDGNVFYVHKLPNNNVNTEAYMRSGNLPARYETSTIPPITYTTADFLSATSTLSVASTADFPLPSDPNFPATLLIRTGSKYEFVNYTGKTATTFTGLTRAQAGTGSLALNVSAQSNLATVSSTSGLQVGQRLIDLTNNYVPEGTYIAGINGFQLTLSQPVAGANPTVVIPAMGATTAQDFTYSALAPTAVEFAYPTFAPAMSHWGTSVIMDGRYDDDKSLVFTYGQRAFTAIAAGASQVLLSIRVAPSVDNGVTGPFGARELINRMQLILRALDVTTKTASSSLLVSAILNGTPNRSVNWTNAVGGSLTTPTSSLAQIADFSTAGATTLYGGETTGGFFTSGTTSVDLNTVRDLGNSLLGGGDATTVTGIYPDGPDVLTIVVTNIGASSADVATRLSWTEAQA